MLLQLMLLVVMMIRRRVVLAEAAQLIEVRVVQIGCGRGDTCRDCWQHVAAAAVAACCQSRIDCAAAAAALCDY